MAENVSIVKHLQFEENGVKYAINATKFNGYTWEDIENIHNGINQRIDDIVSFDALRYMGALDSGDSLPANANKGDVYKVAFNGEIAGAKVEIGDMLICAYDYNKELPEDVTDTSDIKCWDVIQGNVDVEALLAHTHNVTITPVTANKDLEHIVELSKETITATFKNGAASVTGVHNHTASSSVKITPQGSNSQTSITPKGTVTLTSPASKGTNDVELTSKGTVKNSTVEYVTGVTVADHDAHKHTVSGGVTIKTGSGTGTVNYTPAGSVGNSDDCVTDVSIGDITHDHTASASSITAGTPTGKVTIEEKSAGGSVAAHNHDVSLNTPTGMFFNTVTFNETSSESDDGVLTFSRSSAVTSVSVTSVSEVAPEFTAVPHSHDATFLGDALGVHTHTIKVDEETITPALNVTKGNHTHDFNGTGVNLVATHNITTEDANVSTHIVDADKSTHAHDFEGGSNYIHAAFEGTSESHTHDFTGTEQIHNVDVTVNNYTGNFSGTATGDVEVANGTDVVKGVTIAKHVFEAMVGATATTGTGVQE